MNKNNILLNNLNIILEKILIEIEERLNSKKKAIIKPEEDIEKIDFNTKKTIGKITSSLRKKLESSSAYKKKMQMF